MVQKKIACCYTRFSTDNQNESSTIGQLRAIKAYCEKNGIDLVETYIDEAQSGTNMNRTNFQRLLADAPNAIWDTVIVYNMSRLSRSVKDTLIIKEQFKNMGKKIISIIENQDETPEGEFFNLITYGLNELFVKQFKRDSWRGMLVNANDCKVQGGIPLFGYSVGPDKKYIINEEEAKIVKIIFEKISSGHSYREVANYLNSNGFTNRGKPFKITFTDMLKNEKYKGVYIWNLRESKSKVGQKTNRILKSPEEVIRIEGGMPRIIEDELFNKVQTILSQRKQKHKGPRTKYLLSGLIKCGLCGRSFSGGYTFSGRNKSYRSYYKCTSNKAPLLKCQSKDINKEYLDMYINKLLGSLVLNVSNANIYKDFINKYIHMVNNLIENKINKIEGRKQQLIVERNELGSRLLDSTENDYISITKLLNLNAAEHTRLDNELIKLRESVYENKVTKESVINSIKNHKNKFFSEDYKAVIHNIVSRIDINNEKIETYIDLTYMFDFYDFYNERRILLNISEERVNVSDKLRLLDIDYSSQKLVDNINEHLKILSKS